MATVECLQLSHFPQLLELINTHLGAVVPGWALTERYLAGSLERITG